MPASYARGAGFRAASGGINNIIQMLMAGRQEDDELARRDRQEQMVGEGIQRQQDWRNEDLATAAANRAEDLTLRADEIAAGRAWDTGQAELDRSGALSRTLASRQPMTGGLTGQFNHNQLLTNVMKTHEYTDANGELAYNATMEEMVAEVAQLQGGSGVTRPRAAAPTNTFQWGAPPPASTFPGGANYPARPGGTPPMAMPTASPAVPEQVAPQGGVANIQAALTPVTQAAAGAGPTAEPRSLIPSVDTSLMEGADLGQQGRAIMNFLQPAADKMKANLAQAASYRSGGPMGPPTPTGLTAAPVAAPTDTLTQQDPEIQRAITAVMQSNKSEAEIRSALMDYFKDEAKVSQVLRGARGR